MWLWRNAGFFAGFYEHTGGYRERCGSSATTTSKLVRSLPQIDRPQSPFLTSTVYFNEEFRRHQKIDNPLHIIGFLSQWKMYLDGMPQGQNAKEFKGKKLDSTVYEKVRKLCHLTVYKAEPYLFTL